MFKRFTTNPKHETSDCAIRSFANAEGKEWREVAEEIFQMALDEFLMPNDFSIISKYAEKHGYEEGYVFPDNPINVEQFAQKHSTGKWVVLLEDHAMSVIDGDWYDLVDCSEYPVVSYWEIK